MTVLNFIGSFLIGFIVDFIWARYILATSKFQYHLASIYSVLIGAAGILVITDIAQELYLTIGWLIGLYAGTYISLKVNKYAKR